MRVFGDDVANVERQTKHAQVQMTTMLIESRECVVKHVMDIKADVRNRTNKIQLAIIQLFASTQKLEQPPTVY